MQEFLESFGIAMRIARKKRKCSQAELAQRLHMAPRTIIQIEQGRGSPRFETIMLIARELKISLDAILFPEASGLPIPKEIVNYFGDKSEEACWKYIALCRQADSLNEKDKR